MVRNVGKMKSSYSTDWHARPNPRRFLKENEKLYAIEQEVFPDRKIALTRGVSGTELLSP